MMKTMQLIGLCTVLAGTVSCTSPDSEITLGRYRVTYKASVESGQWFGNYTDRNGSSICVCIEPYQSDGWLHSFTTNEIPAELSFEVTSEFYPDSTVVDKPDVTASIYINGELLKTQTNSLSDGRTKVSIIQGTADIEL